VTEARRGLADLLPSVLATLGAAGCPDTLGLRERVGPLHQAVVLLIDGLGYHLLPPAARVSPFLADVVAGRVGTLEELASPFPSTTPVSLVTLGTGLSPGVHGIVGFTVRRPGTTKTLTHITWRREPDYRTWQPAPRLLEEAAALGIDTVQVSDPAFVGSGLTDAAFGVVRYRGTKPGRQTATGVARELAAGSRLIYAYHAGLDAAGHRYGVDSRQWRAEAGRVGRLIARITAKLPRDSALFVTADHGMLDLTPAGWLDMDTDPRLSEGVEVVAGEPRVRYLHPRAGARADVAAAWQDVLGTAATVHERDELIEAGWFGPVTAEHAERIGELVVVCRAPVAVAASAHEPPSLSRLIGLHGSITPVETAIPLLTLQR
jgi:hypothetical protein